MPAAAVRRRAPLALLVALALLLTGVPGLLGTPGAHAVPGAPSAVFINELHDDDVGADADELVEVVAPAGTDLSTWSLVFYNGNGGRHYAAAGQPTTDIGVAEPSSTPVGRSLQLTGTGSAYGDFTWDEPLEATPGAANVGQSIGGGDAPATLACDDLFVVGDGRATAEVAATDPDDEITSLELTTPLAGVTLSGPRPVDGGLAATLTADGAVLNQQSSELTVTSTDAAGDRRACTVTLAVVALTPIGQVQGVVPDAAEDADSLESPMVGERVVVQGVVHARTRSDSGQYGCSCRAPRPRPTATPRPRTASSCS